MAPEYLAHGQLTEKADVYSFGVLLLEMVTGMENNITKTAEYTDSLVAIAWNHFQQNKVDQIFDPNLMMHLYPNSNYHKEVIKVVQIGLLCTQEVPSLRPSMSKVLKMLAKDDEPLPIPSNPPFIDEKTMELNVISQRLQDLFNRDDDSGSVATVDHTQFYPSQENTQNHTEKNSAAMDLINSIIGSDEEGRSRQRILTFAAKSCCKFLCTRG